MNVNEKRKTVLFIDDNQYEMLPLVDALEAVQLRVVIQPNPAKAKEWLDAGNKPDLILCDLMMVTEGGESLDESRRAGVRFAEQHRDRVAQWGCPILVLTGLLNENVRQAAREVSDAVLSKPIDPDELIKRVLDALNRAKRPAPPR